ncbi:replication initiation protein RepC [Acetobacter vaccinii]|uniref:Replicator initiator RepC n=1 Tax=Acetobacter vaccinii TaxID=2592655 RepID=A0A5C1YT78_9PROT|nr:replication initiation protein RepC [Acetobacter vaccinii]QEO18848.1 replicator initiator RepC [Acetobacter vaccinii]
MTPDQPRPLVRRGKRTLTPAMLAAREELKTPVPAWPGKYELLNVLRALPTALQIGRNAYHLLIRMVEKTTPEAWVEGVPFIYAHNATLMAWSGLSLSGLRRAIRELADARFLVASDGRNGQRGRRWQGTDGDVVVGFSLASLRYRWPELQQQLETERRQRAEITFLRDAIADLYDQVRYRAEQTGREETIVAAARLMRLRRQTLSLQTLQSYHEAMTDLWRDLPVENPADKEALEPQKTASCIPEVAPMDAKTGTHYTESLNTQKTLSVDVAAQRRICIEMLRCEDQDLPTLNTDRVATSALRGFKGTSLLYMTVCPSLREFCHTDRPSQDELADAARQLSGRIGITWASWKLGCTVLGVYEASVTVIIMAARLDQGESIRFRDAYFRSLIERGARHQLHLDRSLHALRQQALKGTMEAGIRPSVTHQGSEYHV